MGRLIIIMITLRGFVGMYEGYSIDCAVRRRGAKLMRMQRTNIITFVYTDLTRTTACLTYSTP